MLNEKNYYARACQFLGEKMDVELDDDLDVLSLDGELDSEEIELETEICPDCDGDGVIIDDDGEECECEMCMGTGEITPNGEEETMDLDCSNPICPNCGMHLNVSCDDDVLGGEELEELDDEELDDEELDESTYSPYFSRGDTQIVTYKPING